jgi:hypothetical protein
MRRFTAVFAALALVALMAAPAMAAPGIKFSSQLQMDPVSLTQPPALPGTGTASNPYIITLGGQPGVMHVIQLMNVKSSPPLVQTTSDATSPKFYLTSSTADLAAYFAAKGWPQDYLDQINKEIAGTSPFFSMVVGAGNGWFLADGFHSGLTCVDAGGTSTSPYCFGVGMYPLQMDDDYPSGTYAYTGDLYGLNHTSVTFTFYMRVVDPGH